MLIRYLQREIYNKGFHRHSRLEYKPGGPRYMYMKRDTAMLVIAVIALSSRARTAPRFLSLNISYKQHCDSGILQDVESPSQLAVVKNPTMTGQV